MTTIERTQLTDAERAAAIRGFAGGRLPRALRPRWQQRLLRLLGL